MDSTSNLQPVGIDKKQVTWVAITMIGVLLIALILPLVLILQDSGPDDDGSKTKAVKIVKKAPDKAGKTGEGSDQKAVEQTIGPKRNEPDLRTLKTPGIPADSNSSFGLNFSPVGETETVEVKQVIDGDSLILEDGRKLRLLGIQAPAGTSIEAKTSTAQLKKRVEGKSVVLSFDEKKIDRYKRVLAYVFCDGVFVNGWMAGNGYAYSSEWKPNTRHSELLKTLQETARSKKRGFWAIEKEASEYYLTYQRSRYFHRPGCKRVAKAKSTPDKLRDRDSAFEAALIPCNDCRP